VATAPSVKTRSLHTMCASLGRRWPNPARQLTDPAVRWAALAALRGDGLAIDPDAKVRALRRCEEGIEVDFEDEAGAPRVERFAFCLAATGRTPNVARPTTTWRSARSTSTIKAGAA
jgi:hypothetical protein